MVKEFNDYWAIVLGGSSGLGLAAARKLAAHGMHLCIIHRDTGVDMPRVQTAFDEIRAGGTELISFNVDAASADKRAQVIATLQGKRVRCLLHSVAKGALKSMPALTTDDFRITLEHMAYSLYDWTKDLQAWGLFAPDARILAFTSEGSTRAWPHYAAVSAAKAALEAITRNIALEFAPHGIRANCIQAGVTNTRSLQMIPGHEQITTYTLHRNPFQRLTTPEDVANVVYLLCKDEAAWINGAVIPVDGGSHIS
jgi:enoyl-[acyl-carrier protein] reductase III